MLVDDDDCSSINSLSVQADHSVVKSGISGLNSDITFGDFYGDCARSSGGGGGIFDSSFGVTEPEPIVTTPLSPELLQLALGLIDNHTPGNGDVLAKSHVSLPKSNSSMVSSSGPGNSFRSSRYNNAVAAVTAAVHTSTGVSVSNGSANGSVCGDMPSDADASSLGDKGVSGVSGSVVISRLTKFGDGYHLLTPLPGHLPILEAIQQSYSSYSSPSTGAAGKLSCLKEETDLLLVWNGRHINGISITPAAFEEPFMLQLSLLRPKITSPFSKNAQMAKSLVPTLVPTQAMHTGTAGTQPQKSKAVAALKSSHSVLYDIVRTHVLLSRDTSIADSCAVAIEICNEKWGQLGNSDFLSSESIYGSANLKLNRSVVSIIDKNSKPVRGHAKGLYKLTLWCNGSIQAVKLPCGATTASFIKSLAVGDLPVLA